MTYEFVDYTKEGAQDAVQRYDIDASQQQVNELFDGLDTDGDGGLSQDNLWDWSEKKYQQTDLEIRRYGDYGY